MAEIRCDIPIAYVERLWNDTCVFVMFYLSSRSFLTWRLLWKCRSAEIKPNVNPATPEEQTHRSYKP